MRPRGYWGLPAFASLSLAGSDRFIANGERKPTGQHPFDQVCQAEGIEHRLIKPKHPQTNGMVERFNGRISEILATTHFDASRDLQETLYQYQKIYNYHVPQKNIGHITPIQALKDWHKKQPELFKKKIYDLSGLDTLGFWCTTISTVLPP